MRCGELRVSIAVYREAQRAVDSYGVREGFGSTYIPTRNHKRSVLDMHDSYVAIVGFALITQLCRM